MTIKKLSPEILRAHKGISFTGVTTSFYCHDGNGKLFFAQRSKNARDEHGTWDPGGGGLKHGQSVEESLRRELLEEYNVTPLKTEFIGYYDAHRITTDGQPTHWVSLCFIVKVDPKQLEIMEPDMVDDSGWFEIDNLPSPLHSQFPVFWAKFEGRLRTLMASQ